MSSRKKIWSIPIAVLALVLMLAGGLLATGIVQAQTAANVVAHMKTTDSNIVVATVTVSGLTVGETGTDAVERRNCHGRQPF